MSPKSTRRPSGGGERLSPGGSLVALCALVAFGFFAACAPKEPAKEPAKATPPAEAEPAAAAESEPEEAGAQDVPEETAVPTGPGAPELVGQLCREICGRVKKSCSPRAADFCHASCGDYVSGAEECPTEVHEALRCQTSADDFLLCSNIAAESCAPLYTAMNDCRTGIVPPKPWGQKVEETKAEDIPAGFARLRVQAGESLAPDGVKRAQFDFSHFAPEGTKVLGGEPGGLFKAAARHGDFEYVLEAVSHDNKKPLDAKTLLRATTEYVGSACQPKLRLHGRYDTKGVVHTRFDTVCADGTEIHGMMHFWGENIVAASVRNSAGGAANPNLEPFIFSFELSSAK